MTIRKIKNSDVQNVFQLIQPYVKDFAINRDGEEKFSLPMIQKISEMADVEYFVKEELQNIIGVIAYKKPAHLLHFFVDQSHQNKGVGRQLWEFLNQQLKNHQNIDKWTVNSSCYAKPIYEKLGFITTSDVIESHGIRFIQMEKIFIHSSGIDD
ncbi:GNAT family N-acetyltransferase [Acinetobacter sp. MD2(2019)]|uniref:GNAT family N-acetyltransferase n=1 Tax=Acinetobacter sp. MD2(2019) TaxID=2605273 RepID=UPI002D1F8EF2|nr:GNAT family N-acetyltransferase [Acinetobacter sp. MD2(2019)]MEB3754125.1 GNAT family N-acetyltransferase [Acinetobacter sp. MD2(2019)]